jgi:hypothetical protein
MVGVLKFDLLSQNPRLFETLNQFMFVIWNVILFHHVALLILIYPNKYKIQQVFQLFNFEYI